MISRKNVTAILAYECQVGRKDNDGQSLSTVRWGLGASRRHGDVWGKTQLALHRGLRRFSGTRVSPVALWSSCPTATFHRGVRATSWMKPVPHMSACWNVGSHTTQEKPVPGFLSAPLFKSRDPAGQGSGGGN